VTRASVFHFARIWNDAFADASVRVRKGVDGFCVRKKYGQQTSTILVCMAVACSRLLYSQVLAHGHAVVTCRHIFCSIQRPRCVPQAPHTVCAAREKLVLGIESSCDDTGVAIVSSSGHVLGEATASQAHVHKEWGGVVPTLAQEAHAAAIDGVVNSVMQKSNVTFEDLDAVAVTIGPGLSLCLKVGVQKARQIAHQARLAVIPCHHMEAHALVARMGNEDSIKFPFLCLLVSGGHNLLVLARGVGNYMQVCLKTIEPRLHLNPWLGVYSV
jgi:hypothetical protein